MGDGFAHVSQDLYRAALAYHSDIHQAWSCYLSWAQACWAGQVSDVLPALKAWLIDQHIDLAGTLDDQHPGKAILDAHRYLTANQSRMNYAEYRRDGLPVTTALMESMVKEVNQRVKGTEMFWNDPQGAEAILQVRAAALCDDNRLAMYLAHRPGHPFVRRTTPNSVA
jgi:hypothetical protein